MAGYVQHTNTTWLNCYVVSEKTNHFWIQSNLVTLPYILPLQLWWNRRGGIILGVFVSYTYHVVSLWIDSKTWNSWWMADTGGNGNILRVSNEIYVVPLKYMAVGKVDDIKGGTGFDCIYICAIVIHRRIPNTLIFPQYY